MAAKRKGRKTTTRRRSTKSINLLNAAEMFVTTSILTQNLFNANLVQFVTGKHHNNMSGVMPFYNPSTTDDIITLPELFGRDYISTSSGKPVSVTADPAAALATITANARRNFVPLVTQTVGAKVFFTVVKRMTGQQRRFLNSGFKMVGLKEVKV